VFLSRPFDRQVMRKPPRDDALLSDPQSYRYAAYSVSPQFRTSNEDAHYAVSLGIRSLEFKEVLVVNEFYILQFSISASAVHRAHSVVPRRKLQINCPARPS